MTEIVGVGPAEPVTRNEYCTVREQDIAAIHHSNSV